VSDIRFTHPERVLYPESGITKRDLAEYLLVLADRILPHCERRPISLVRCPRGHREHCFFQRHHSTGMPPGIKGVRLPGRDEEPCLYIETIEGLLAIAQLGALEIHLGAARIDDIEHPDRIVFDLDPDPAVAFSEVKRAARLLKRILESAEIESFPMLTGGKGMHVVAPLRGRNGWDEIGAFCHGIARAMAASEPAKFTAKAAKTRRPGRIFVDWLRNLRGASAIAPYSTRAREGCPVAVPLAWSELGRIKSANQYSMRMIRKRLASMDRDPWRNFFRISQDLPPGMLELFRQPD
jgi:bifunctional non-homologous end joining protein LigD